MGRGFKAGVIGAANSLIGAVSYGSGFGWSFGIAETLSTVYYLGLKFPGLMKRGTQQFLEGVKECSGQLSFGHWKNLRGLGPLGLYVDDPCETYPGDILKKREAFKDVWETMTEAPLKGMIKLYNWLIDWVV